VKSANVTEIAFQLAVLRGDDRWRSPVNGVGWVSIAETIRTIYTQVLGASEVMRSRKSVNAWIVASCVDRLEPVRHSGRRWLCWLDTEISADPGLVEPAPKGGRDGGTSVCGQVPRGCGMPTYQSRAAGIAPSIFRNCDQCEWARKHDATERRMSGLSTEANGRNCSARKRS
jgi:hypothetical protein